MAVLLPLLAALVPAAATAQRCDGPGVTVDEVRFVAERWVDRDGLRRIAKLEPPFAWSPERATQAEAALMATKTLRSVAMRLAEEESSCALVVELDQRPIVTRIDLRGVARPRLEALRALWNWITFQTDKAPLPSEREVFRLIPLRTGSFFDEAALDRATQRILARYHASGYQTVSVATHYAEKNGRIAVEIVVTPGSPLVVNEVQVAADDPEARVVTEEVLREQLGRPKSRIGARDAKRAVVRALRRAGFFDSRVVVDWRPQDPSDGSLRVDVVAGPRSTIEIIGNESISRDDLIASERLFERVIVTDNTWRQLARSMRLEYQRSGYFEATVELERPEPRRIIYRIEEGARYSATEPEFEGNESLSDTELRDAVASGDRRWFSLVRPPRLTDTEIGDDIERILERYRRAGFEAAAVSHSVSTDAEEHTATVTFTVTEGLRTWVQEVDVAGDSTVLDGELVAAVAGEPLDVAALEGERNRVVAGLLRRGYLDAKAGYSVERETLGSRVEARVSWKIESGALHRVGDIVVQENAETKYVVIERDLPFERGDPIESTVLRSAEQDVFSAGVFRNVSIATLPATADEEDREAAIAEDGEATADAEPEAVDQAVAVRVAARPPGRFSYGLGYDTVQGFTGFGELSYANLNRRAQSLRLRGQIGFEPSSSEPTQYLATVAFVEPRLLDGVWDWQLNLLAERNTRTIDQYNIERYSVATGSSRELAKGLRFGADLQVEYASVFDVKPVPFRPRDEADTWSTALSPFLILDRRDNVFNPSSGFLESLRLRYAIPGVSKVDLIELAAQHTQLIPLWSDWGFVYSVRVGWIRSLDGNPIVPIRQRYFVGGGESVRGFAVNSLGPYDGTGQEVGGDLAIVTKSEIRIPIYGALGLVLFVDGGANYLLRCDRECRAGDPNDPQTRIRDAAATFGNFRFSSGVGLRYLTPIGPISVDYGFKLDRRTRQLAEDATDKESLGEFSISIGARF